MKDDKHHIGFPTFERKNFKEKKFFSPNQRGKRKIKRK